MLHFHVLQRILSSDVVVGFQFLNSIDLYGLCNIIAAQCHGNARYSFIYFSVVEKYKVFSGESHTFYCEKNG
jgi:hypothetical protein